ncbi:RNA-directed DNA polymerase, eukaryota, reverse transcriptase zinc-binding domain protein, partial [Tanacetum coccineum]
MPPVITCVAALNPCFNVSGVECLIESISTDLEFFDDGFATKAKERFNDSFQDIINSIRISANKYAVLNEESDIVNENENGNEEEVIDVYDETSGNRSKQNAVKDLIVDEKLSICAVLETRLKDAKVKRIGNRVFGRWKCYGNAMECNKGRKVLKCGIIHASDQAVLCLFDIQNSNQRLFCTFIHAEISGKLRRKLWADLSNYKSIVNDTPWVITGDLNVSLNLEDHFEGMSHLTKDMEEFRECINHVQMEDICSSGLIRDLMLPYGISDHSPAILTCPQTLKAKKRSFRFANYVADKEEFQGLVKEKWKPAAEGFAMFKLVKMLKVMRSPLSKLNWKNSNLFEKVKKLKLNLDEIQTKIDADPTNISLREQGVCLTKEYITTLEDEEKLLLQNFKVEWLKEGNRNSAYFHKALKSRSNRCRVEEICGEDNVRYSGDQVQVQFVRHFQKFLGVQENIECLDLDESLFLNKISPQDAGNMINYVTNKEIKDAMFDINDNKAPGPNGFTARFFKKAWDIVGNDVCLAVKEFFTKGKLLGELNATIITLVPKVSTPLKVSDFRPIACCNVVYKCISKIITNRIKGSLDSIVNKNQSAFIPERQITDNILLTQELLKGYDK